MQRTITSLCEGVVCKVQNSQFMNVLLSMITLFWSNMGIVDLSAPTVDENHQITRAVAITIFVVYHILSIIILLNMLIAMMNLSYDTIVQNADVEWKFARAKVHTFSHFPQLGSLLILLDLLRSSKISATFLARSCKILEDVLVRYLIRC